MWDAYSSEYQAAQLGRGVSKENMQAQVETLKLRGLQFQNFEYVGGKKTNDGNTLYTYYTGIKVQNRTFTFPVTFTVDGDGKVTDVMSPLNNTNE
ncbi:MAG: hypothetical protein HC828_16640 [Blastochloris sp.]|nr:hypothetical protein [Blastochloris sp.]